MGYAEFKAPKGLIKVEVTLTDDKISRISISGDFFMYPEDALEKLEEKLIGTKADRDSLLKAIHEFYKSMGIQTPMIKPEHWVEAILRAVMG
ncbi:MAG: lipoate--protein ligase family protein [Hadesarchaea archaeon]|nr:lipoate--protein ligase family protein [Hadesarchaea archaeon]